MTNRIIQVLIVLLTISMLSFNKDYFLFLLNRKMFNKNPFGFFAKQVSLVLKNLALLTKKIKKREVFMNIEIRYGEATPTGMKYFICFIIEDEKGKEEICSNFKSYLSPRKVEELSIQVIEALKGNTLKVMDALNIEDLEDTLLEIDKNYFNNRGSV